MTRILHVGDLHFWRIPLNPFAYLGKRALGVGNLVVGGRARKFRQFLAPIMAERFAALSPDMFLFSGDFSSTALPGEFAAARDVLSPLVANAPLGAITVPGNHDCYVGSEVGAATFARVLGESFRPTTEFAWHQSADAPFAVAAFNAGARNGLDSFGRLRSAHVDAFARGLENLDPSGVLLILCHFPPEIPHALVHHKRGVQLLDCQPLLQLIATHAGNTIWLHGHDHHRWIYRSPTVANLTYLNAGAPMLCRKGWEPDLGFHELLFTPAVMPSIITHWRNRSSGQWKQRSVEIPAPGEYEDLQKTVPASGA